MPPMSLYLSEEHFERRRRRRIGDLLVALACCLWLGVSGWVFFRDMPEEIFDNHTSKTMQDRMKSCEGSFQKRYDCKQALLLSGERWGFAVAIDRLMLMCAPPLAGWIVWSVLRRRQD